MSCLNKMYSHGQMYKGCREGGGGGGGGRVEMIYIQLQTRIGYENIIEVF